VDVTYGDSRPNIYNYNYTILGSSTGLSWNNQNFGGTLVGDINEQSDPSNKITWGTPRIESGGGSTGGAWYSCNWPYRKKIVIDHNQVPSDQNNFPVLISLTENELKSIGNGGHVGLSTGTDILFTAGDGITKLNHELEVYVSTTGALMAWVQVSTVSHSADTSIFMYYGNSAASDQQNKTGTWNNNYVAVYHLPNGSTLSANDSTSNGLNGTLSGATPPAAASGQIDGAGTFDGTSSYVDAGTSALFNPTTITASAWVYLNGSPPNYGNIMEKDFNLGWRWRVNTGSPNVQVIDRGVTNTVTSVATLPTNTWTYLTFTGNTSGISIFINGVADTTNGGIAWGHGSSANTMRLGYGTGVGNDEYFKGTLDELRVSSIARSPDWVATEYNNQSNPSGFYSISAEASAASTISSIANGAWSATSTWSGSAIPTQCNPVNIVTATTVTVDTSAMASTTTITGQLSFSRIVNSTFTLVGGNLNVNAGGTLDLGTASSPLTASSATLILAYGQAAGQYGLIANDGANFLIYGAAKNPRTVALSPSTIGPGTSNITVSDATGWRNGDVVAIDTETVTISALSGNTFDITAVTLTHSAPIFISNLSRSVLIRSSGTVTGSGGNSAYVESLITNTTSFNLNDAEFAYLGETTALNAKQGLALWATSGTGSISSCTVHDGAFGLYLNHSAQTRIMGNILYGNSMEGLWTESASHNWIWGNNFFNNSARGIRLNNNSFYNLIQANNFYDSVMGIFPDLSNTFYANQFYRLTIYAVFPPFDQDLFVSNLYVNNNIGLNFGYTGNATFINDASYGNTFADVAGDNSSTSTMAGCSIGISTMGVASGTGIKQGPFHLVLKGSQINPSASIPSAIFNQASDYILNYSTQTGVLQLFGDYRVTASTLTLDYTQRLYSSTATTPQILLGASITNVTVSTTSDADAVTQLVMISYDGSNWNVTGSSTGLMGQYTAGSGNPQSFTQFTLSMTYASPQLGDVAAFGLLAASPDSSTQKKLYFGASDSSFNQGRSKIEMSAGAGFHAVGISTAPTLIDMLPGGTYYSFVDSGTFTVGYASFSRVDENGLWLNGSGGVSMDHVTFDYAGSGVLSSSTYITANVLTSTATFRKMTFKNSNALSTLSNIAILGSDASLSWIFLNANGPWVGDGHEKNDVNNKIRWSFPSPLDPNGFFNVFD